MIIFFSLKEFYKTLYDGELRTSHGVFRYNGVTSRVSCELPQPMSKTDLSSTAKGRTNSIS